MIEFFDDRGVIGTIEYVDGNFTADPLIADVAQAWVNSGNAPTAFENFYTRWTNGYISSRRVDEPELDDESDTLIAAARDDKTDGAMIALVPRDADQLALDGYESPDELHLTLFFLGDADEITPTQVNELVTGLIQLLRTQERSVPIFAQAFGVAHWNPESENPAWVLNVGDKARDDPSGLTDLRLQVEDVLRDTGIDYPPQHSPWQPHICIAYSDEDLYSELASRLGPVTFDTLRVAWGEYDIDIPLTTDDVVITASVHDTFHLPSKHNQKSHGNRAGKKDNVPSKSSKHAPLPKTDSTPKSAPTPASNPKPTTPPVTRQSSPKETPAPVPAPTPTPTPTPTPAPKQSDSPTTKPKRDTKASPATRRLQDFIAGKKRSAPTPDDRARYKNPNYVKGSREEFIKSFNAEKSSDAQNPLFITSEQAKEWLPLTTIDPNDVKYTNDWINDVDTSRSVRESDSERDAIVVYRANDGTSYLVGQDQEEFTRALADGLTQIEVREASATSYVPDSAGFASDIPSASVTSNSQVTAQQLSSYDERVRSASRGSAALESPTITKFRDLTAAARDGKITEAQEKAARSSIRAYGTRWYSDVNMKLRRSQGVNYDLPPSPDATNTKTHDIIDDMDTVMNLSTLSDDVIVHRGIRIASRTFGDAWDDDGDNTGLEFQDFGFTSTSVDQEVVKKFQDIPALSRGAVLNILVPKGSRAIGVDQGSTDLASEKEILLNRGMRYRVLRDYRDAAGVRMLDVEVIS